MALRRGFMRGLHGECGESRLGILTKLGWVYGNDAGA